MKHRLPLFHLNLMLPLCLVYVLSAAHNGPHQASHAGFLQMTITGLDESVHGTLASQVAAWEKSLEAQHLECFRLQCYLDAVKVGNLLGNVHLPVPRGCAPVTPPA